MSFLNELTVIQKAGIGAVVVLLLVLLIVKRRQSAAVSGAKSAKAPKAEKPPKTKKVKAEKPVKEKRSRRAKADKGKRRRRGTKDADMEPASPIADVPPSPETVPVASVAPVTASAVTPESMPVPPVVDDAMPPPGWPAPGEAWIDVDGTSSAVFDPVPGADPGGIENLDPTPFAEGAEQPVWTPEPGDPVPGFADIDPTDLTQEWTSAETTEWAPAEDPSRMNTDDLVPSSEAWAEPDPFEWTPVDDTSWAPEASNATDWAPQDPVEAEWTPPPSGEWEEPESEWPSSGETADPTRAWALSDEEWTDDIPAPASGDGWTDPDSADWTTAAPVDESDLDVVSSDPDWASEDTELPSADQLVSEATGISMGEDTGALEPAFDEATWEPVDTRDLSEVETSTFAAVPSDDASLTSDDGFDGPSDEEWSPSPIPDDEAPRYVVSEPSVPAAVEEIGGSHDALPVRRPALETLHHLSARVQMDETDYEDGPDDDVTSTDERPSVDAPIAAPASIVGEEDASPMSDDAEASSYDDATPSPTSIGSWGAPAPAEPVSEAPAASPVTHASSPRRSWADMTPAPVKPAEALSPTQRWARLRPSTGPAPRPAVPAVAAPPASAAPPKEATTDVPVIETAARRGRFALGAHAAAAGQETVSGVTYRSQVVPPPSRWQLGPITGPVASGTLVLIVEGLVNCSAEDLEVVMEPGFAPTVDGFSLRLRSADGGSFAASGTFEIH